MKKRLFFSIMMAMATILSATAQSELADIRKHYAEAQQKVAEYEKAEMGEGMPFPQYYEVNIAQNLPGTGPHRERMRLYFYEKDKGDDWQPDEPFLTRSLHFVTFKYNYAAREFYEEYLYDEKGNIEFVYKRDADLDENGGEIRLYYNKGKLIKVLVSRLNPNTEKYEQTFSGAKMPEKYKIAYESCLYNVEKFKRLFDEIDRDTFH